MILLSKLGVYGYTRADFSISAKGTGCPRFLSCRTPPHLSITGRVDRERAFLLLARLRKQLYVLRATQTFTQD